MEGDQEKKDQNLEKTGSEEKQSWPFHGKHLLGQMENEHQSHKPSENGEWGLTQTPAQDNASF